MDLWRPSNRPNPETFERCEQRGAEVLIEVHRLKFSGDTMGLPQMSG